MKRTWAGLITLILVLTSFSQVSNAAVKAGGSCTKLNAKTTVSGYKYTCIKSGKKLVWSKGVKVAAATPTPTPSVSATPTPTPSASATPTPTPSASSTGTSTVADKYSDQPCKVEGEDLKIEGASYKCMKRADTGALLWAKNNAPAAGNNESAGAMSGNNSITNLTDQYQGQPCEIEGRPFVAKNAQYVCIKLNGKLILSVNNGRPSPKPSQLAKPISATPSNLTEIQRLVDKNKVDSSVCKVKQHSDWVKNATAFPFQPTAIPDKGKIDVAVVYLDWADSPGTDADYQFYENQVKMFKDFYWMVSENTLDINASFSKKWFRIPGSYKNFITNHDDEAQRGTGEVKQKFYDAAIAASDSETNFAGIEIVIFAIPTANPTIAEGLHEFNIDYNAYLKTAEGNIYDTVTAGDSFIVPTYQPPWVLYVHEVGHMIGIPHQADESWNTSNVVSQKYQQNPLGGWDIMSFQGGGSRTINSWLRWLAGWLSDQQVSCITKDQVSDSYYELHPINEIKGNVESLVVKLSDSKVLVVESRRFDSTFDIPTGNYKDGVLVYTVDANKGSAQGNQVLLTPRDISKYLYEDNIWWDWKELDAMFFQGDSVIYEGLKIEVVYSGTNSDIVKVSKVG